MVILLFGPNGQVGWELQRSLAPLGEIIALDRHGRERYSGDLADVQSVQAAIQGYSPDVIVNAAAYTNVDQAESEPEMARMINAQCLEIMTHEAGKIDALFVHYSTDYVFDGSGVRPWQEEDVPNPINVYGQTKLEGERAIVSSGCRYLIFRTSWVYSLHGHNFLHTILRLAAQREYLRVINDQIGTPTGAELIADVTAHAVRLAQRKSSYLGIYHLAAGGETSWWGYARLLVDVAAKLGMKVKVHAEDIEPVLSTAFPTSARRPCNSRLNTTRLAQTFGLYLPSWEQGVVRVIRELRAFN